MVWNCATPGIPDAEFERDEGVPITKEEVRALQISKARLCRGATVLDIGCGSGSVTVEAAIQVGKDGRVCGVDHNQSAADLSKRNLERFGLEADIVCADALEALPDMPDANAVFVGGMGGSTRKVLDMCCKKLRPGGRIVIGTILIETLFDVLDVLGGLDLEDVDITQVTIAKSRKTSTGTMMLARNPVTIVSATRK